MCLFPIDIKNPSKTSIARTLQVPCNHCAECRKKRANQWTFRLQQQQKISTRSDFITLTYATPFLKQTFNGYPKLVKKDLQNFLKSLRRQAIYHREEFYNTTLKQNVPKISYYAVGEYGPKEQRPHYHIILFNLPNETPKRVKLVTKAWKKGTIDFGNHSAGLGSIRYVTGYVDKQNHNKAKHELDDRFSKQESGKEFALMSKGLGANFLTPQMIIHLKNHLNPYIVIQDGLKTPLPNYYKEKIFTTGEKLRMSKKVKQRIEEIFINDFEDNFTKLNQWRVEKQRQHESRRKQKTRIKKLL